MTYYSGSLPIKSIEAWVFEAIFLHEPLVIVSFDEFPHSLADVFQHVENPDVDRLLLERFVEAFSHAACLMLLCEREARTDTKIPDLFQEVVRQILRSVVHTQG